MIHGRAPLNWVIATIHLWRRRRGNKDRCVRPVKLGLLGSLNSHRGVGDSRAESLVIVWLWRFGARDERAEVVFPRPTTIPPISESIQERGEPSRPLPPPRDLDMSPSGFCGQSCVG
jgi:hypothetical protein